MAYFAYVRHGLSQANLDKIVAGHLDTPLTDIGRQQARDTAALLRDIVFHCAYGSPLQRAKETLEIILGELSSNSAPVYLDELKERDWGDIEGVAVEKRGDRFPSEVVDSWFTWDGRPPNGESYADMATRVARFFDEVALPRLKAGQNVLVVAHNGISKPLQRHLEGIAHNQTNTLNLKNCEVKLYQFDEAGQLLGVESRVAHNH